MNHETFSELGERAKAETDADTRPAPVDDILRVARQRRARRRGGIASLGVALAAGAVVIGAAALQPDQPSAPPTAAPRTVQPTTTGQVTPPGTRWVGLNGVVVAVPDTWGTDEVGCDATTPIKPTVVFGHHQTVFPTCGVMLKQQVPSLRVDDDLDPAAGGEQVVTAEGIAVRHGPMTTDPLGFATSWIEVPDADVRFTATAQTPAEVEAILDSLRRVPDGSRSVPNWHEQKPGDMRLDQMTSLVREAGLEPVIVEEPGGWQRPGGFLRTVPEIGTPVPDGSQVEVVYAAGNLAYYATAGSLAAGGWAVGDATDFEPPVSRDEAKRAVGAADFNTDAFLRTMSLPVCQSAGTCAGQTVRQVWLVVDGVEYVDDANTTRLVAVDARTGEQVAEGVFRGTS